MACYSPLQAFQRSNGEITFTERGEIHHQLELACGQCIGCRLERSRQWAVRCMHEASLYEHNCFVTLTYSTENLPDHNNLVYRDFQLFMKKLRQAVRRENKALGRKDGAPTPRFATTCLPASARRTSATMGLRPIPAPNAEIRFYMAGEYGAQHGRPHFHACIFNLDFLDKQPHSKTKSGSEIYRSPTLEQLWPQGFSSVGALTFESAAYTARYVMKKVTGGKAEKHYEVIDKETGEVIRKKPEFNNMSRKPGIASRWLAKYTADVYPEGKLVVRGIETKPPRYYDLVHKKLDQLAHEDLQYQRQLEAKSRAADNTPERLAVRRTVTEARIKSLKRTID